MCVCLFEILFGFSQKRPDLKTYEVEFEVLVNVEVDECICDVIKLFGLEFAVRAKTNI